jgi:hypothetical protein
MLKPFITTVALIAFSAGLALGAEKRVIHPKGAEPNTATAR